MKVAAQIRGLGVKTKPWSNWSFVCRLKAGSVPSVGPSRRKYWSSPLTLTRISPSIWPTPSYPAVSCRACSRGRFFGRFAKAYYIGIVRQIYKVKQVCAVASVTQHRIRETCIGCGIVPPFSTPMEESGGQGRIRLKNPCISSNRLPWLWPYPWRQSATNLIFCVAGPSKCRRLGVCFPGEHSLLQSPLHREAFPRRALPAGRQSQWDLIPVRGGESATLPQLSEMDRAIARRTG